MALVRWAWPGWDGTKARLNVAMKKLENALNGFSGIVDAWLSGVYNVRSFGAKGDGVTDDTAAIQRTVDEAKAAGRAAVYFPPGDYVLSSGRIKLYSASGITIVAHEARLLLRDGCDGRPFVIRNSTDVRVEGLTIKDECVTPYHNGIDIQDSSRVTVTRCRFYDVSFYGVVVCQDTDGNPAGPWGPAQACNDITLSHCYFENCKTYGAEFFPKYTSYRQHATDNTFVGCGRLGASGNSGAAIKVGSMVWGAVVSRNIVYGGNCGLNTGAQRGQLVVDNWFIDCNQFGVAFTIGLWSGGSGVVFDREQLTFRGNQFIFTPGFAPTNDAGFPTLAPAIEINGAGVGAVIGTAVFEDNLIWKWSGGVQIEMTDKPVVTGSGLQFRRNRITDTVGSPFFSDDSLGATIDDILVEDNYFESNDAANTSQRAVFYGDGMRVVRNTFVRLVDVLVKGAGGVEVAHNRFLEPNFQNVANTSILLAADTAANTYRVHHNYVDQGTGGNADQWFFSSGPAAVIEFWENQSVQPLPLRASSAVTLRVPLGRSLHVRECGAAGDGVVNDAAALNEASTIAGVGGRIVYGAGKTYRIASPVSAVVDQQTWEMDGATISVDFAGVGIRIGQSTAVRTNYVVLNGPRVVRAGAIAWTAGDVGIQLVNAQWARVRDFYLYGFNVGVEFLANSAQGCQHNRIEPQRIVDCGTPIRWYATGAGSWCNANKVIGGHCSYSNALDGSGRYCLDMQRDHGGGGTVNYLNENDVIGLTCETAHAVGRKPKWLMADCMGTTFVGIRAENFASPMIVAGTDWALGENKFFGSTPFADPATDVDLSLHAAGVGEKYTFFGRNGNHLGGGSAAHPIFDYSETNGAAGNRALRVRDTSTADVFRVRSDGALMARGLATRVSGLTVANSPWTPTVAHHTHEIDASGGAFTVNLPAAAAADMIGHTFVFKKTDASANVVTINRAGGDTIDGLLSLTLSEQHAAIVLQSNGVSSWRVVSSRLSPTSSTVSYAGGGTTILTTAYDFYTLNMTGAGAFTFNVSAAPTHGTKMRYVVRNGTAGALGAATVGANLRTLGYANPGPGLQTEVDLVYDATLGKWTGVWSAAY